MIECFFYWIMQKLGYRKFYLDHAFMRGGVSLTSYEGWSWRPKLKAGNYAETKTGYKHEGYGVDRGMNILYIEDLIRDAVRKEREECAELCEMMNEQDHPRDFADNIRSRTSLYDH